MAMMIHKGRRVWFGLALMGWCSGASPVDSEMAAAASSTMHVASLDGRLIVVDSALLPFAAPAVAEGEDEDKDKPKPKDKDGEKDKDSDDAKKKDGDKDKEKDDKKKDKDDESKDKDKDGDKDGDKDDDKDDDEDADSDDEDAEDEDTDEEDDEEEEDEGVDEEEDDEEVLPLTIETLTSADWKKGKDLPDEIMKYDGKKVRISGYMASGTELDASEFELVPQNCECGKSKVNHFVKVIIEDGGAEFDPARVQFTGRLEISEEEEDGFVTSLYRLTIESFDPVEPDDDTAPLMDISIGATR